MGHVIRYFNFNFIFINFFPIAIRRGTDMFTVLIGYCGQFFFLTSVFGDIFTPEIEIERCKHSHLPQLLRTSECESLLQGCCSPQ